MGNGACGRWVYFRDTTLQINGTFEIGNYDEAEPRKRKREARGIGPFRES